MLQPFDQSVLDAICDKVTQGHLPGLIGWSIGRRDVVAHMIARSLKIRLEDVQSALSRLVAGGYLGDELNSDDDRERKTLNNLALLHKAWKEYSRFNEQELLSRWDFTDLDEWSQWDGINGSPLGGYGPEPFRVPLRVEVVRLPSEDYEVLWNNQVIWSETYQSSTDIPSSVGRIAEQAETIEEFVCRLIYLKSDTIISEAILETRDGWKDSSTVWADLLRWYWHEMENVDESESELDERDVYLALIDKIQEVADPDDADE